jgi:hypothetical protein
VSERVDLGVRTARTAMEALGDDLPVRVQEDAPDPRVGPEGYAGARGELERATHGRSFALAG